MMVPPDFLVGFLVDISNKNVELCIKNPNSADVVNMG